MEFEDVAEAIELPDNSGRRTRSGREASELSLTAVPAFPHPFYMVEQSSLLADFHRSSVKILEHWDIKHFAIYSIESCVDVLSLHPPKTDEL